MSNYSEREDSVRVDFFKPSGKWYTSVAIEWEGYSDCDIIEAFRSSLEVSIGDAYRGMTAVCLEPYHEHSHPIMIVY